MDYVSDALTDGTRLRSFNVLDDFTRECLAIEVDTSIPGLRATRVMDRIAATRPLPKFIICETDRSSPVPPLTPGPTAVAFASTSSGRASTSRTPTPRASTASCATSASTRTGSSPWTSRGRGSRRGGSPTTRSGRTRGWTTSRRQSLLCVTTRLHPMRHRTVGQVTIKFSSIRPCFLSPSGGVEANRIGKRPGGTTTSPRRVDVRAHLAVLCMAQPHSFRWPAVAPHSYDAAHFDWGDLAKMRREPSAAGVRSWQTTYLARFYSSDRGFIDGTTQFWTLLADHIAPGRRILEIGAGPSNQTSQFLSSLGELYGIDVDPVVLSNRWLTTGKVVDPSGGFPFPSGHFAACVSDFVVEHIEDPQAHFLEVARVLEPGGVYVLRAPNAMHYVSLAARITPHWFHELVANRLRQMPQEAHDPYVTYHRGNTRNAVMSLARRAGLNVGSLTMIEKEPSYGMSSRILFLLFMAYERLVNATEALANFRANMLVVLRKPKDQPNGI